MRITIHAVRPYVNVNLNRDLLGNPKSIVLGGVSRTVVSAQCIAYHERKFLFGETDGNLERSRYLYRHYVLEPLLNAGVQDDIAQEIAYSIDDVAVGRKPSDVEKRYGKRNKTSKLEKLTAQITAKEAVLEELKTNPSSDPKKLKGEKKTVAKEEKALLKLHDEFKKLENPDDEDIEYDASNNRTSELQVMELHRAKLLTELALDVKNDPRLSGLAHDKIYDLVKAVYTEKKYVERANSSRPDEGALFGIKSVGDYQPTRDATISKMFAISYNEQYVEEDFFNAGDRYEKVYGRAGSGGAAHMNTAMYCSPTLYMMQTIDIGESAKMLGIMPSDERMVGFCKRVVEFFINGPLGAKKAQTNPDSFPSHCVLVEFHEDPQVSLVSLDPAPKDVNVVRWAIQHLHDKFTSNNKQFDRDPKYAVFCLEDGIWSETKSKNLLLAWVADTLSEKPAQVMTTAKTNGVSNHK